MVGEEPAPSPRKPRRGLADRTDARPEEIIRAFNRAKVDYVIIGGLAAIAHGVQRITRDADFLINPDPGNCRRTISALVALGAEEFLPASKKWVRVSADADPDWLMRAPRLLDSDAGGIDICNGMQGVPTWAEAEKTSIPVGAFGESFRVLSKDILIRSKLAAGREKDQQDVAELNDLDWTEP